MYFLKELRNANEQRDRRFDPDDRLDLTFRGLELAGETGELSNIIKKIERNKRDIPGNTVSDERLQELLVEEIGDVLICLDLVCMEAGVDLEQAVREKFNKTSAKVGFPERL